MVKICFYKAVLLFTCLFFFVFYSIAQRTSYFLHTIKAGETLEQIAIANKTMVSNIMKLNNMTAKSVLKVGKNIKIPFLESTAKTTAPITKIATVMDMPVAKPIKQVDEPIVTENESVPIVAITNKLTPPTVQPITIPVSEREETISTASLSNKPLPKSIKPAIISATTVVSNPISEKTSEFSLHTIKAGETLSGIAKANKTTVGDIMRLNGMNEKSILKIGENVKIPGVVTKPIEAIITPEKSATQKVTLPVKQVVKQPVVIAPPLVVEKVESGASEHIIKAGETLSGIAKANKTTVGDIMRLNEMNSKSILKVGASIKITGAKTKMPMVTTPIKMDENLGIPVKPTTIIKQPEALTAEIIGETSPIEYTVAKGDNLYRISKNFKTTEAQLMQWNGMKNDIVKPGQVLIVGKDATKIPAKLETKDTAGFINSIPPPAKPKPTVHFSSRERKEVVAAVDSTIVSKPDSAIAINPKKMVIKRAVKDSITSQKFLPKESSVNLDPEPIPKYAKYAEEEGFYAGFFNRKNISKNSTTGDAAIFKSKSGWDDKKFYVLINDINQGTIVRITTNNKSVCAQVKGPLPNIKEDIGLLIRVNSAAADALSVLDGRFSVTVNY